MTTIEIRDIETLEEMHEVEQLQREIWGVEDLEIYPALALKPQKEVGATLIGAFAEGRMVGFVFGFPGILDGETIIHSDMLGISPAYRSNNLGYLLKRAQRDAAIALGVKRITWTFDPLQSRNAHFNFSKLGVIADRYYVDYYGVTSSFLHRYGTDRLWVTWLLDDETLKSQPSDIERLPHLVRVGENLEPIFDPEPITSSQVVIEIPRELTEHHKLWRIATRDAFTRALEQGLIVQGFYNGRYYLAADNADQNLASTKPS
ncbi:MAG TPA: GNAT family N-acetyltransferase [Pyrinomonadaceae bacterium]|nr:GNAT family N-acetyltransferase [Pyrinomonadaceae bacterium]